MTFKDLRKRVSLAIQQQTKLFERLLNKLIRFYVTNLPWWTEKEEEQASQELHFLKQPDPETREFRDIRWMYFRRKVLDKYRNNFAGSR
ncbi:MAG: hypothetical protein ACJ72S_09525 [Nitrososphaeraceae archaeon]